MLLKEAKAVKNKNKQTKKNDKRVIIIKKLLRKKYCVLSVPNIHGVSSWQFRPLSYVLCWVQYGKHFVSFSYFCYLPHEHLGE